MKVVVFGATGTVGRLAVAQMLEQGHEVTAFARRPEQLDRADQKLRLQRGDAMDPEDVSRAVAGQDAVVVALGAGASRKSRVRSRGTLNVIRAMQEHGVRRLICQSTLGAHDSWDNLNFWWKRVMFGMLLKPVFLDHQVQEDMVRASGLDWTLVRPSAFSDAPASGRYEEAFGPEKRGLALKIPRADVAGFLARQLGEKRYVHRAVAISC